MKKGTLFLIPTPISSGQTMKDILLKEYIKTICKLDCFISETPKTARALLKELPLRKKIQDIPIEVLNEHTKDNEIVELLLPILEKNDVGLLSDAGSPSIADPGFRLVQLAQEHGIRVIPFVGPSSILLALMASGLNGQNFAFNGYLPKDKGLKRKRIKTLERIATSIDQTQIFMETPYRNQSMLEDILDVCEQDTKLCIAMYIMSNNEYIVTKKISEWKGENIILEKNPCLFLINK